MNFKDLKNHIDTSTLNIRCAKAKNDEHYRDPNRMKNRESYRISKAKKYRENDIENLKTKKKHL